MTLRPLNSACRVGCADWAGFDTQTCTWRKAELPVPSWSAALLRRPRSRPSKATARGRMLSWSHWRVKAVTQRPSLPVRQPPTMACDTHIVWGVKAKPPVFDIGWRLCCMAASLKSPRKRRRQVRIRWGLSNRACRPPAKAPPSGPGWLHEIKHDGFRILARRDSAGVRLITRETPPAFKD
jgi:hypothetical protein